MRTHTGTRHYTQANTGDWGKQSTLLLLVDYEYAFDRYAK